MNGIAGTPNAQNLSEPQFGISTAALSASADIIGRADAWKPPKEDTEPETRSSAFNPGRYGEQQP
jgi:hypothetical protein